MLVDSKSSAADHEVVTNKEPHTEELSHESPAAMISN
jgi:hypothetical protein